MTERQEQDTERVLRYISEVINDRMKEKGYSLYKLYTHKSKLTRPTVENIVRGNKNYTIAALVDLINVLDLRILITKNIDTDDEA